MKRNILVVFLIILIDQITKYFIEIYLYGKQFVIIENIFALSYVQNKGGAWGIMSSFPVLFLILVPLILVSICLLARNSKSKFENSAWYMIVGGALGNYIDRFTRGYVVDFFDFYIWPVFNVADIFVVAGCILLILSSLKLSGNFKK